MPQAKEIECLLHGLKWTLDRRKSYCLSWGRDGSW